MTDKITSIRLDGELYKKLQLIRIEQIQETGKNVTLTDVIEQILKEALT